MELIDRTDKSVKKKSSQIETLRPGNNTPSSGRYCHFFKRLNSAAAIYRPENNGRDFIVEDINPSAEKLDNISRSEAVGRNIVDVFPKTFSKALIKALTKVNKSGKPENFHVRILKDGEITGWRVNYVFKLPSGDIAGVYSCDTKRRQMDRLAIAHRKKLRQLTSELSLAEERQRRKIAANLHDELSQWLAISAMKLDLVRGRVSSEAAEEIDAVSDTIRKAILSVRGLIFDLSSPTLYRFGLEAAVFEFATNLFNKHEDINCEFIAGKESVHLSEDISVLLFQSIRELLFNIIKYADAGNVIIEMKVLADCYQVKVSDDGIGFDVSAVGSLSRSGGFGLFHITERLEHIGGKLFMDSQPSKGSRFYLQVPYSLEE